MSQSVFSVKEAFKWGWQKTLANLKILIGVLVLSTAVSLPRLFFPDPATQEMSFLMVVGLLVALVILVFQAELHLGMLKICLGLHDGRPVAFKDAFSCFNIVWKLIASAVVYGLIVGLGFLLLIVPGIILALRLYFFNYFLVDKGMGPIQALKQSWNLTKGMTIKLLLLTLASVGINVLGALCFGLGLLVTVPTTILAFTYVYRKMLAPAVNTPGTQSV